MNNEGMVFVIKVGRREPTRHEDAGEVEHILIGILTEGGRPDGLARSTARGAVRTLVNGGRFEPDHEVDQLVTAGAVRVWREGSIDA